MSHQIDSKNCCHGRYSFRGFGRIQFNGMMNKFESRWLIAIIGEVHAWFGKRIVTIVLVQHAKLSSYCKNNNKKRYDFAGCSFCC